MNEDPQETQALAERIQRGEEDFPVPEEMLHEPDKDKPINKSVYQQIHNMTVGERLKLALKGNREARLLLLRDSNRMIQRFVLKNPRVTEDEIIAIARNRNVDSDLLREVGDHNLWPRNYQIRFALATNPKTPLATALPLVSHLSERELRFIAKSKNVPAAVVSMARRIMIQKGRM